ncbi:orotidine 5'-phosphate decarboxylase / HUMPS family protein [Pyrobaculum aerophilum]|uniref:orotidine 5'-phosphate decarboxylase / HUMPS family protein n=1 Tax=Pyrobaculum aerophilum TaxID=13773 RepID=UPI0023F43C6A|nr:orotidine 5'-phosphate decarboxylase / HUMPS family protein [Pyrobaculum aerophilum]MCX8136210.1 orotidine 5'-phosphate decarboxylase [Pyrobaculum aerophilum]
MNPVIVALDISLLKALDLVKMLREKVAGFKIGWELIFEGGISIVSEISRYGNVIVDLKVADVPHIANRVINKVIEKGACCAIVHGFLYPSLPRGENIYVLAKMTAPTLYDEVWERIIENVGEIRGFVLPGNQPEFISRARKILGCKYRIISPGIGAQGGQPGNALGAGADFEIVGRYVVENPDRVAEWTGLRPACFNTP